MDTKKLSYIVVERILYLFEKCASLSTVDGKLSPMHVHLESESLPYLDIRRLLHPSRRWDIVVQRIFYVFEILAC